MKRLPVTGRCWWLGAVFTARCFSVYILLAAAPAFPRKRAVDQFNQYILDTVNDLDHHFIAQTRSIFSHFLSLLRYSFLPYNCLSLC